MLSDHHGLKRVCMVHLIVATASSVRRIGPARMTVSEQLSTRRPHWPLTSEVAERALDVLIC